MMLTEAQIAAIRRRLSREMAELRASAASQGLSPSTVPALYHETLATLRDLEQGKALDPVRAALYASLLEEEQAPATCRQFPPSTPPSNR